MGLQKKFTFLFLLHLILLLIIMFILIIVSLISLSFIISKSEMESDFTLASQEFIEHAINVKGDKVTINNEVKSSVLKKGGWLQLVDSSGKVIGEFNTPKELTKSYKFTDLVSIGDKHINMYHWNIENTDGSTVTVLYGEEIKNKQILMELISRGNLPNLSDETKEYLDRNGIWFQMYDPKGEIVRKYAAPKKLKYSFSDLLNIKRDPRNSIYEVSTYTTKDGYLYLLGTKNVNYSPDSTTDKIISKAFIKSFLVISAILVLFILGIGIWYGKKLGVPLLQMMRWINHMSEGEYSQPTYKKSESALIHHNGMINKKYNLFKDIIHAIDKLAKSLEKSEELQMKVDKTREEWIAGLSHDLKTPISSIYGYSALLTSDTYKWTSDEMKGFGEIINEKAEYMSGLIEDLNLTYRLKNDALPIKMVRIDIVSFIKELIAHHYAEEYKIYIDSESPAVNLEIDSKWFTRIINNLLVNAIKHNPVGTMVHIKIKQLDTAVIIIIEDNGKGMDEETVRNLFTRYYRGGNTTDSDEGSGLGMAIAHQLILAHNGTVKVTSKKNEGTAIQITFLLSS